VDDEAFKPMVLVLQGQMHLQQQEQNQAREKFAESLVILKEKSEDWWPTAEALIGLARVVAYQGEVEEARALYQESLDLVARTTGCQEFIPTSLEGLANVAMAQDEPVWAARLWGAAEALREAIGTPLPPVDRADYEAAIIAARTSLGEKAFTTAWAQGSTMTPEQALAAQGPAEMPLPTPTEPPSAPPAQTTPTYPAGLTTREVEVLRLLAKGLTDAQIAEQLVISPRTVNNHLTSIYSRIQVSSRSAATRYAIEHHLI
jgi:DNA-binding CsgD family transcriptional regulator